MAELNYYKILRLRSSATPKAISNAYRDLSILYRDSKEPVAKEIMKLINEAYLILQDPGKRAAYDLEIAIKEPTYPSNINLSDAEKIIGSWGTYFTLNEQEYIEKIHAINKILRIGIFIVGIIFIWSVVTFRWDISFLIIFGIWFVRNMIWSIYRIKNPPPPLEVWAIE